MNQEPLKSVENFDDFLNMKYNNFGSDIKQEGKEDKFERNKDDTLDITIFRDLGSKKNENFFNKAELNAPAVTSDPKINKLLSDVDDIVQRALGNAPKNDNTSTKDKWGINKYTINGVKNVELENQEIRAYLKNLDCKLNIIAPTTTQALTPEKKKCANKITEESEENSDDGSDFSSKKKSIKNQNKYNFDESPQKKSGKKQRNKKSYELSNEEKDDSSKLKANVKMENFDFDNSFRMVDENKKMKHKKNYSSPTHSQISRTSTRTRSIFLKEDENKKMKASEMKNYMIESEKICDNSKIKKELEANEISFCVNCEEFLNVKEINSHSSYCLTKNAEKENFENKASEIKIINEKLSKLMKFLFSKLNTLKKSTPKNALLLLSNLIELTSHLIHSKDFNLALSLKDQMSNIYENLLEIYDETIMKIFLPISEKLNLFFQQKIDCLNTYSSIARSKYNKNFENDSLSSQNIQNKCDDMLLSKTLNNKRSSFCEFSPSKHSNLGSSIYGAQRPNAFDKIKKKQFFELGIQIKLGLNKNHPAQKLNFSDLFLKCCNLGIGEREWKDFILESVTEMEEEIGYQNY